MKDIKPIKHDGKDWYTYAVKYESDGKQYSFHICATSMDHAICMVQDIRETATYDGQILAIHRPEGL